MQNNQRAFKDYQNYRQFRGNPLWLPLQLSADNDLKTELHVVCPMLGNILPT